MNKIPFQNNTVIPPEWLNAIQDLSYDKEPGEAGYIPNPDDFFHFQQWKTFFTEYDEENDWCSVNYGTWEGNVILRSPYTKHIVNPTGVLRNAILILITDFAEDQELISFVKYQSWSADIPKGNIGVFFFDENGLLSSKFPLPCSSSSTNAEFNALKVLSSITLPALSILSEYIATGAVTSDKIATGAVTIDKIGSGAVTPEKIATGAVTSEKINALAVTTAKLASKAVTTAKIAADVINLILDSWTISHRWPSSGPTMKGTNFPFPRPLVRSKLRITTLTNTWSTTEELVQFVLQYGSTPITITNLTSGWSSPVNFVRYIDVDIDETSNLIGVNYINVGAKENAEGTQLDMNFTVQSIPSV